MGRKLAIALSVLALNACGAQEDSSPFDEAPSTLVVCSAEDATAMLCAVTKKESVDADNCGGHGTGKTEEVSAVTYGCAHTAAELDQAKTNCVSACLRAAARQANERAKQGADEANEKGLCGSDFDTGGDCVAVPYSGRPMDTLVPEQSGHAEVGERTSTCEEFPLLCSCKVKLSYGYSCKGERR